MGIVGSLRRSFVEILVERPARRKGYTEWIAALQSGAQSIDARAAACRVPESGVKVLRHITGIERWGQSRMRVFLGEPFQQDEYDGYAPAGETLDEQRQSFRLARAETISLARRLAEANLPEQATVVHNSYGPITARGWLAYLNSHANREVYRIR